MSLNAGVCSVLVCFTVLWFLSSAEAQDKCVACSYNLAGDGTRDYACVNDSLRQVQSTNVNCNFATHRCVIKAVYRYKEYQVLQSVTRSCLPQSATSSEVCGYNDGLTCLLECNSNMCNAEPNADLARTYISSSEAQDKCVACSYNFAGDGTTDYACVNDSLRFKHSRNITCNFNTHRCVIRTVYRYSGYRVLQSVARSCLPQSATSSEVCGYNDRRTCLLECKSNMCNAEPNADLARTYISSSGKQLTSVPARVIDLQLLSKLLCKQLMQHWLCLLADHADILGKTDHGLDGYSQRGGRWKPTCLVPIVLFLNLLAMMMNTSTYDLIRF